MDAETLLEKVDDMPNEDSEHLEELTQSQPQQTQEPSKTTLPEDILQKRKQSLTNWIKKPNNLILVAILVFAFIIRLYYFSVTKGQVVWWDEAEYMNMARAWAGALNYEYIFFAVRPVLLSLIISVFLKIGGGEPLIRASLLVLSIISIYGMYLLGKEMFNKKLGLITAFFMSVFSLHLFQTYRILVDLPSLTFSTFAAFFFYRYFKTKENKALYIGAVLIGIGTLFRITTAMFLFAVLAYLLITERLNFLKKKEYWIAAVIFLLILSPYFIWGYFQFNGFVISQAGAWNAPQEDYFGNGYGNMRNYFRLLKPDLTWPLLIFFYLGLIAMYKLVLGFDVLMKGKNLKLKRDLLLVLLFIIPIIVVSLSINNFYDDRYILTAFPAMFIISTAFILKSYDFIKKKNKIIAIILLALLLGYIGYLQLQHADASIKTKVSSYYTVKEAGLWLKENSGPYDKIITSSAPQIEYYSERHVIWPKSTEEEFDEAMASEGIRFYMVSVFEVHEQWVLDYPAENNLIPLKTYFADASQQQAILVIYDLFNQPEIPNVEQPVIEELIGQNDSEEINQTE